MKKQLITILVALNALAVVQGVLGILTVVGIKRGFLSGSLPLLVLSGSFAATILIFIVLSILLSRRYHKFSKKLLYSAQNIIDGYDIAPEGKADREFSALAGEISRMNTKIDRLSAELRAAQIEIVDKEQALTALIKELEKLGAGRTNIEIDKEHPGYDVIYRLIDAIEDLKNYYSVTTQRMMGNQYSDYSVEAGRFQGVFLEIVDCIGEACTWTSDKIRWYEGMLDSIPFLIHATDMDMNWTFLNKATEDFLGLDRRKVRGMHCSNWNAEICNTDRCSAYCLRQGNPTTFFQQDGMDLRVDTNWLLDNDDKKVGYVEVVQNISDMVKMQKKQTKLVNRIQEICLTFVSSTGSISDSAQIVATGAVEQATSVESLKYNVNGIAEKMENALLDAEETMHFAHEIGMNAKKGVDQMENMMKAVTEVNEACEAINNVIKVIEDMAFQTDILALNASIEAAKAGAAGKGFEVVAENVRSLSFKTNDSVTNIRKLIIDSKAKAETSALLAKETSRSFEDITEGVVKSDQMVARIVDYVDEQKSSIDSIRKDVEQVSYIIQQNTANSEQSAAASEELAEQSRALQELLDRFSQDDF